MSIIIFLPWIQVFNDMAQFYRCFIKQFVFTMEPIAKLIHISKPFVYIVEGSMFILVYPN
jgi:hypothetical protein